MLPCIYTKDKKKKLKMWEEGFYKYSNRKITVFDSDKKQVCTKVTKLQNEIDTFKYLIYIENIENVEEEHKEIKKKEFVKQTKIYTKKDETIKNDINKDNTNKDDPIKDDSNKDDTNKNNTNKNNTNKDNIEIIDGKIENIKNEYKKYSAKRSNLDLLNLLKKE